MKELIWISRDKKRSDNMEVTVWASNHKPRWEELIWWNPVSDDYREMTAKQCKSEYGFTPKRTRLYRVEVVTTYNIKEEIC